MVLAGHKVPARVTGGTVTPRLVRFHVTTPLGVKVRQVVGLAEEIALSLGAPTCRVYRHDGQVEVEVPREQGQVVHLLPVCRQLAGEAQRAGSGRRRGGNGDGQNGYEPGWSMPPITAVLGLDHEGVPLLLRLPSPNVAHALIAGTTGSGKTALARTIVASLAWHNHQRALQVVLIDPKGRGFAPFAGLPHLLDGIVDDVDGAARMLARLVATMEQRDAERRAEPRIVIAIDELADLVQVGGRPVEQHITRLTQRGREAGMHLVACTQKPAAAVIGSLIKSNFPVRLVGAVTSPEDAKVATGMAGTGAEQLLGQGDFLVVAKGQVTRMQAAYIAVDEMRDLVAALQAGERPALPAAAATGTDGALARLKARLQLVK